MIRLSFPPTGLGRTLAPVMPVFRRHRLRLAAGFLALLAVDGLQLAIPRFLKQGIDLVTRPATQAGDLLRPAATIVLLAALVLGLRFCWRLLVIGFSRLLECDLRNRILAHLLTLDRSFFQDHPTGELMAHASNDLSAIQLAFGMGMVAALDGLVMGVAACGFMLAIDVRLTLVALSPMVVLALATRVLAHRMHTAFARVQEQFGRLTEFVRSTLVSIRLIQGYCLEPRQVERFDRMGRDYVRANIGVARIQGTLHPLAALTGNLGVALVLWWGGRAVIGHRIGLGDLVAFLSYLNMLVWPMMAIGWVTNLAQRGLTSLARVNALLAARPRVLSGPVVLPARGPARIECHALSFTYPGTGQSALADLDLVLEPGITGLAGRSGSGKSTLCSLLIRQFPVEANMILVDGHDLNRLDLDRYLGRIGFVSQQPLLFSASIAENIGFGRPGASQDEIEQAARAACIHEEIMELRAGYQTRIGEQGVLLSGGQRQRICLARALLADRPVLIIDDGLSALDVETEQQVMTCLRRRYRDRILLLVSHRINLLDRCDRMVMLEKGRVVGTGGPAEMRLSSELYRAMRARQNHEG